MQLPLAVTAGCSLGAMVCLASWAMGTTAAHTAHGLSRRWQVCPLQQWRLAHVKEVLRSGVVTTWFVTPLLLLVEYSMACELVLHS
jgi:hypothetical protein